MLAHLLASGDSSAAGFRNKFPTPSLWALENQAGRRQLEHFNLHLVNDMGQSPGAAKPLQSCAEWCLLRTSSKVSASCLSLAVPYTSRLATLKV